MDYFFKNRFLFRSKSIRILRLESCPAGSAISNLLHYGHPGLVTDTMVDGRFLMRDGQLTTMDETEVLAAGQSATESLWHKFAAEDRGVPLPATDPA